MIVMFHVIHYLENLSVEVASTMKSKTIRCYAVASFFICLENVFFLDYNDIRVKGGFSNES